MATYEVRSNTENRTENGILSKWFGNLWQQILDRLDCGFDGYVMSVHIKGSEYRIYRN